MQDLSLLRRRDGDGGCRLKASGHAQEPLAGPPRKHSGISPVMTHGHFQQALPMNLEWTSEPTRYVKILHLLEWCLTRHLSEVLSSCYHEER